MIPLVGALSQGLIFAFLGFGILITYRYFDFPDMTTDASFTTGAAISMSLMYVNLNPFLATFLGVVGGSIVGMLTGILHTRFSINKILAGIIIMIMMYSINLHIMGGPGLQLNDQASLVTFAQNLGLSMFGVETFNVGDGMPVSDVVVLALCFFLALIVMLLLYLFLHTHVGLAMRSAGENPEMARSVGINVNKYVIIAIALANGLTALSGSLFSQYNSQMVHITDGVGMIMRGLSGVILGRAFLGRSTLLRSIIATLLGILVLHLLIALIFELGCPPGDFRLFTGLFLLAALILPDMIKKRKRNARNYAKAQVPA